MSAPKSATARRVGLAVLILCLLALHLVLWGGLFSLLRDGRKAATLLSPAALVDAAWNGDRPERRKLGVSFLLVSVTLGGLVTLLLWRPRKLFGSARFGGEPELKAAGLRSPAGVVLGSKRRRLIIAAGPSNTLGCGPPGSGKGAGWVCTTLFSWKGSVVVLDPKVENWSITAGFRDRHSAPGDTVLFNPLDLSGHGWRYNPLGQLASGVHRVDQVERIANMLIPAPLSGDTYWASGARALFVGAVLALAELQDRYDDQVTQLRSKLQGDELASAVAKLSKPQPVSIGSVYRLCVDAGAAGDRAGALAARVTDDRARRLLGAFAALPMKQAEGVLGALTDKIGIFGNPAIDAATSASDFTFKDLRRRRQSIYLGVAPANIERLSPLLGLMFQQVVDEMTMALPGADEPVQWLLLIDEFALLKRMPVVASSLAFIRGYGGSAFLIVQSPAQLDEHYGQAGRRTIIDTCKQRVFYAPNDLETATQLSRELGTYTVRNRSRSTSAKGGSSTSVSAAKRELLLPQEVLQMPRSRFLLFVEGAPAILGDKLLYFRHPLFASRASATPPASPHYPVVTPTRAQQSSPPPTAVTLSPVVEPDLVAACHLADTEAALVEEVADLALISVITAEVDSGNAELRPVLHELAAARAPTPPDQAAQIATFLGAN